MRPLKLTMSAFGPYAAVETIDFGKLKDKNIFLITGPTGAGKTTIFDAISYGLFGEASGSSRDNDSLRSDFASWEVPTFVEFEFELRGKKYTITRFPQQNRKKARGEGVVAKTAEAYLALPSGDVVTKVNNVDEKISGILGINKNQFKQIVMLPQGEFRKLLESDSSEREVIFRKIFGTEAFEAIQRNLDEQKKLLYRKISETKTQRDTHAKHIEVGDNDFLEKLINAQNLNIIEILNATKELIEKDGQESKKLNEENEKLKVQQEKLQKSIVEGEEINKKLREKSDLQHQYSSVVLKEKEYEEKQVKLDKARKAIGVQVVEKSFIDRQNNLKVKQLEYNEAQQKLKEAEKNIILCKEQFEKEEIKENERKQLSDSIATFKNQEEKVKAYEEKSLMIIKLKEKLKTEEASLKELKLFIDNEKLKLEKANKDLMDAQKAETEREKLDKAVSEKDLTINEMIALYQKTKEYVEKFSKYENDSKSFEEFDKRYNIFKSKYELMEDNFRRGQAGLLAKGLKEGMACPVCGSTQHLKLAQLIDGVPTEDMLKEVKDEFDILKDERDKQLQFLSDLNGVIKNSKDVLLEQKHRLKLSLGKDITLMSEQELLSYLTDKGKEIRGTLNTLKKQQSELIKIIEQKSFLEESITKLGNNIKDKEILKQNLENEHTQLYGKVKGEEELLISIEKEIPLEIRSFNKLSLRIRELECTLRGMEKAYKVAQDNYNKANTEHASSRADKEGKEKNVQETVKEVDLCYKQLNDNIKAAGFEDYEQYATLKMTEESIKLLEKDIAQYYQNLKSLRDRVEKSVKDTVELKEVSLQQLTEAVQDIKSKKQYLEATEKNIYSRVKSNKKCVKEIETINEAIREDEEKYGVIGELARVANGDNSERITFERYVLAAYFDEIINAANVRLNKMAGGRFILRRKEEKGKGKKQEGLELEVFDNYTGKARHVKTLSGGESFKASLALALGLADVVQSYAGGINLDTMFVDEGFGTLDPESLDNAIQCLIDLQKGGRLVGIISHVPELKERIDSRLEVTPAKEGSKAKFVV